jgi:hypothetical protein
MIRLVFSIITSSNISPRFGIFQASEKREGNKKNRPPNPYGQVGGLTTNGLFQTMISPMYRLSTANCNINLTSVNDLEQVPYKLYIK